MGSIEGGGEIEETTSMLQRCENATELVHLRQNVDGKFLRSSINFSEICQTLILRSTEKCIRLVWV